MTDAIKALAVSMIKRLSMQPKLIRIKAKGWLKWFKKDKFILEYEHVRLTGDWHDSIVTGCLLAGERPIYEEK